MGLISESRSRFRLPWWLVLSGFLAIAITMNWEEHRAHILGILPYLFFLACPLMHFFMHHDHGGHEHDHDAHAQHRPPTTPYPGARP